jgi:hypothetical protein
MVKLLPEEKPEFSIKLTDLHNLEDLGILTTEQAKKARREIDSDNLYQLILSDPESWPPILITLTDKGYGVVDGDHRWIAASRKGMKEIRAECKAFSDLNAVIDAKFSANLTHGLKASVENRSDYARWLHTAFPEMTQEQIAEKCKIRQATVSKALKVNGEKKPEGQQKPEEKRKEIIQDCKRITRDASRLLEAIKAMSEAERRAAVAEAFTIRDRETLLGIVRLLQEQQAARPGEG